MSIQILFQFDIRASVVQWSLLSPVTQEARVQFPASAKTQINFFSFSSSSHQTFPIHHSILAPQNDSDQYAMSCKEQSTRAHLYFQILVGLTLNRSIKELLAENKEWLFRHIKVGVLDFHNIIWLLIDIAIDLVSS